MTKEKIRVDRNGRISSPISLNSESVRLLLRREENGEEQINFYKCGSGC